MDAAIAELADKVGLSQTPCWKRIQRLEQQGVILGRVALVSPEKIGLGDFGKPGKYFARQVDRWTKQYRASETQHIPEFEKLAEWLPKTVPEQKRVSVVHGDYRLDNCMVADDGHVVAVLDWELAHLGDPMEDLGWLCVKAWRFGAPKPVAGVGDYRDLIDAYAAESGLEVDPDVVHWWEVLGTLKWGIMCIMQAQSHLSGAARSHELAAIGRRVCENEHDLFLALEGRW